MEYEFAELEHIVSVLINPSYLRFEMVSEALLKHYDVTCYHEVEKIKKRVYTAVLQMDTESRSVYIHQLQAWLIGFADTIYDYLKSRELQSPEHSHYAKAVVEFYKQVYRHLYALLQFLECNYKRYFDLDARLTFLCHEQFALEINNNIKQLQKAFKRNEICMELLKITCDPFENLTMAPAPISYRNRDYLQVLLFELISSVKDGKAKLTTEDTCNLLVNLNYNYQRFYNYYIMKLASFARDLEDSAELIKFYLLKSKLLKQVPVNKSIAFNEGLPNIRDQICDWISEEIYFLERKRQLESSTPGSFNNPSTRVKIQTSLPVSQLSLALKLLIDSGVIINDNYTELLKLVAQNFSTEWIADISEESLRNKYYNIEKSTADKMKDVVVNLLNLVRRY